MDQDETWQAGRPRHRPRCVRWEPSSRSPKGHRPQIFGPYLLWPNGCMDQGATWYGGRPPPRQLYVRWGPRSPFPKRGRPQIFGPCILWPKSWMDQDGTWHGVGFSPGDFALDGDPAPSPKRGQSPLPNFWPNSIVDKRLDASRCQLVWR